MYTGLVIYNPKNLADTLNEDRENNSYQFKKLISKKVIEINAS